MTGRRVAVVGLGVATSLGLEVEDVWRAVIAGRSGIRQIRQFPSDAFPVHIASEVDLDALLQRLGGDATISRNRTLAFAYWASDSAWRAAMPGRAAFDPSRAAVCIGAGATAGAVLPAWLHLEFVMPLFLIGEAVPKLARPAHRRAILAAAAVALLALSAPLQLGIALAIAAGIAAGLTARPDAPARPARPVRPTTEACR